LGGERTWKGAFSEHLHILVQRLGQVPRQRKNLVANLCFLNDYKQPFFFYIRNLWYSSMFVA
jgi:hypothetical protein